MSLNTLLASDEGKTLEFKENANSLHKILQTIVAFANTAGGTLVIGVKDNTKEVVGVTNILQEEERLACAIADSIAPMITPNFQFHTSHDRDILIITVTHSPAPYYIKSKGLEQGVYIRLGSTNRIADQTIIANIQRLATHQSFDELPNFLVKKEDIDFNLAKKLFLEVTKKFDLNTAKTLRLMVLHQSDCYPSNGAVILFGMNRKAFFPDSIIRCGCFNGLTKTHIIDQQEVDEPLPIAAKRILAFIERNTSRRSEFKGSRRVDYPQYPNIVVREAVMNALVHADYTFKGASIEIAIFADRIEITNPGALPYGLSLEKALSGISQLRNRVIGHVFRELGLIERWGSGLGRMIETCNKLHILPPKFEEMDLYFRVTLYHHTHSPLTSEQWCKDLITYLKRNPFVTIKDASKFWRVSARTTSTRLKKMLAQKLVVEVSSSAYDPKKKFTLA